MKTCFLAIGSALLLACGGLVEDETPTATSPSTLTCTRPKDSGIRGTCASAREGYWVEAIGIEWLRGEPWTAGSVGAIRLRHFNNTSTDGFHLAGAWLDTSEGSVVMRRLAYESYALGPCSVDDSIEQTFEIKETLRSGTQVRFDIAPYGDFDEHDKSLEAGRCGGALRKTTFVATVP